MDNRPMMAIFDPEELSRILTWPATRLCQN
jgi:hypothetical protein